jgi:hypothetical protein
MTNYGVTRNEVCVAIVLYPDQRGGLVERKVYQLSLFVYDEKLILVTFAVERYDLNYPTHISLQFFKGKVTAVDRAYLLDLAVGAVKTGDVGLFHIHARSQPLF